MIAAWLLRHCVPWSLPLNVPALALAQQMLLARSSAQPPERLDSPADDWEMERKRNTEGKERGGGRKSKEQRELETERGSENGWGGGGVQDVLTVPILYNFNDVI